MPCYPFKSEDGKSSGWICTRGRSRPRHCTCGRESAFLCDYPLRARDCDAPICAEHARKVGQEIDYCPKHAPFVEVIGDRKILVVNQKYRAVPGGELVDRTTPLGNPYRLTAGQTRELVIQQYKRWLWNQMQIESPQLREMRRLAELASGGDLILICHCAPQSCHAQIIAKATKWLMENGK